MSANKLLKAPNHAGALPASAKTSSVHAELRAPSAPQLGRRNCSLAARFLPASASPCATLSNAVLIAALSFPLAGCDILQPATTTTPTRANLPLLTDTRGAQQLALPAKPPEAPSNPAPPAPPPSPRASETKPPPATPARGAEKLVDPKPAAPVLISAKTTPPPEPPAPPAAQTPAAEDSVTVTSAPVQALILKGPPPETRSSPAGIKVLVFLGLALGGAALAVLARLYLIRRVKPADLAAAGKEELKMPRELLLKEPLNLPPEPVVPEKKSPDPLTA